MIDAITLEKRVRREMQNGYNELEKEYEHTVSEMLELKSENKQLQKDRLALLEMVKRLQGIVRTHGYIETAENAQALLTEIENENR